MKVSPEFELFLVLIVWFLMGALGAVVINIIEITCGAGAAAALIIFGLPAWITSGIIYLNVRFF